MFEKLRSIFYIRDEVRILNSKKNYVYLECALNCGTEDSYNISLTDSPKRFKNKPGIVYPIEEFMQNMKIKGDR